MRTSSLVASVALALAALGLAAPALAAPPPIQKHTLPNGLDVIVVEDRAQPLVTVELAVKNGSMAEPPELNGLSHLYEHMFFKANQVLRDQEAWTARALALGMVWNGTTGTERVNYYFSTTSDHFADTMAFMRDAVVAPLFDQKELEREREVVTGEMDRNEGNPFYFFGQALDRRVWWKYPTRKDPLGYRKTVLGATRAQMQLIQGRYYVPNNSALVVTGDVTAAAVVALAGELYRDWKRADDPFVKYPIPPHPPLPGTSVVVVEQPVGAVAGELVWHGPSTAGQDLSLTYAADVLGYALAEPSSRMQRALVDSGACLGVSFSWLTQVHVGPITLFFQAMPDKVDGCVQAILAELPKMRAPDYLSDDEMKNAAFRAELEQVASREKPSELAHTLSFWWASAGLDYYLGYVEHMRRVTRADVVRFLDEYVLGKPFVLGALVSPEAAKGGLDQAHFEALVGAKPYVPPPGTPEAPRPGKPAPKKGGAP
ncbi:MAG: insulinase family protein [Polyangiaceae bacterium]|nr:insulinase family protein [Polyangiaceae bacterium]